MNSRKNKSGVDRPGGSETGYRGRFAPSASGPLHLGSLLTALASYLEARSQHGEWLLRMEDLDTQRCSKQAADGILTTLREHALDWDGEVIYQSNRSAAYRCVLEQFTGQGRVFRCNCPRRLLRDLPVYPGTCRKQLAQAGDATPALPQQHALRVQVDNQEIGLDDLIQHRYSQQLSREVGDFILLRRDGIFAYQLAVVVDDHYQGITHVMRGADLLDNTPRQIYLQRLLGWDSPEYAHLPIILNRRGVKMSKQTLASALQPQMASANLLLCLDLLRQEPYAQLQQKKPAAILAWAVEHWDMSRIPATSAFQDVTGL